MRCHLGIERFPADHERRRRHRRARARPPRFPPWGADLVAPADNSGRDSNGRFAPGNPGGPGGTRRRAFELRRTAELIITDEVFAGIMRKAARMALEGNLSAIRFIAERVAGRPADVPPEAEPVEIDLPPLETAAACAKATDQVLQGICKGTIDRETAQLLLDGIQVRLKAIEVQDVEARLAALEKMTAVVELPGRRR